MHFVLCCTEVKVAVSSFFMFVSEDFNTDSQSTLKRLES